MKARERQKCIVRVISLFWFCCTSLTAGDRGVNIAWVIFFVIPIFKYFLPKVYIK